MFEIELDPSREQQLRQLAASKGQPVSEFARGLLEEYLDLLQWGEDTPEQLAEASIAMLPEVLAEESWEDEDADNGSR